MTAIPPLSFSWNGEAMMPKHPGLADHYFTVGEVYNLEPREDRSAASHRHYFASIAEAHQSLPDALAERWPTPDHLRRWALIKAGYRDERSIVCGSKAEAQRVAAFVKPIDDYAVVVARDAVVIVYTAKSQSVRAMGKNEFQRSKEAVLDVIAALIGTTAEAVSAHASEAA